MADIVIYAAFGQVQNDIDVSDDPRPGLPWERNDRAICPSVGLPFVHDSVYAQESALPSIPTMHFLTEETRT